MIDETPPRRREFSGEAGRLLLAGNALHADLAPEAAGSGGFGWLMTMLGQTYGFPVPVGGAGALTASLVRRLRHRGGILRCAERVVEVVVRAGRAVAVRTADGGRRMRAGEPGRARGRLGPRPVRRARGPTSSAGPSRTGPAPLPVGFRYLKVDWALDKPVPWRAGEASSAGTVHVAESVDALTRFAAQIAMGEVPDRPFALFGQMTTADPSRSPAGTTESAWAYTHVPQRVQQ